MSRAALVRSEWQAAVAAFAALAITALYLVIIASEGEDELTSGRVVFVAGTLTAAAFFLAAGIVAGPKVKAGLFSAATALLAAWAVLGAFSIGLLLLPAAVFAGLAAKRAAYAGRAETNVAALAALALVVLGLLLT